MLFYDTIHLYFTYKLEQLTPSGTTRSTLFEIFQRLVLKCRRQRRGELLYDKARGWRIIPTRFTHQHSAAQESMGTSIFTTMLLRALRICNNQTDLLQELEFVTYRLLNRGYKFKNLAVACHNFINL